MAKEKVLIIGNADAPIPVSINLDDYRWIAVFNSPRHPELVPRATHHFFRQGAKVWAGAELIPNYGKHVRICLIEPDTSGQQIIETARKDGRPVRVLHISDYRAFCSENYPSGHCPSSGFVALKWFMAFGLYDITVINFNHSGVKAHDWQHERKLFQRLAAEKKINLIYPEEPTFPKFEGQRLGHFVWLSPQGETRDLSGRMWYAVMSFLAHHDGWKVTLHTNCSFAGTYTDQCTAMGLEIRKVEVPLDGNIVNEADALKWFILKDFGGLVMDISDTVTTGNFNSIYDEAHRLKWTHWANECKQMAAGWLCINRTGSDISKAICDRYLADRQPLAQTGRWEQVAFDIKWTCKDIESFPTDRMLVFGGSVGEMEGNAIPNNTLKNLNPNALQLHFYAGNTWESPRHLKKRASLDSYAIPEKCMEGTTIYSIPMTRAIASATEGFRTKFYEICKYTKQESNWQMPEHMVVISLPSRQDRRDLIKKEAEVAGVELVIMDAYYPPKDAKGWSRGPGEIGCSISHQAVIRMALSMDWDSVMVLEDDAVIKPDFLTKMKFLLNNIPSDKNILNIGWHQHLKTPEICPISPSVGIPIIKSIWGTQAYIVRKPMYRPLLDLWEKYTEAIDIELSAASHLAPVYAIESLIQQRNLHGDSNIKPAGKPAVIRSI